MSNRSLTHRFLTLALALTTTSVAFARRPPSLLQRQERAEQASTALACAGRRVPEGGGYRDLLLRFRHDKLRAARSGR